MILHFLPGDALTETFNQTGLEGETAICRECLVDGGVEAVDLAEFWNARADFIGQNYNEKRERYFTNVVGEFEKLKSPEVSEINLWFEYELFCQVNLWFSLYFLRDSAAKIYRVAPIVKNEHDIWKGFGRMNSLELEECFDRRSEFSEDELLLGKNLWKAFQTSDYQTLEILSAEDSPSFPYLKQVCRAAIEKQKQPQKVLRQILEQGKTEFSEIFAEFSEKAGVYGFGDTQVKRLLSEI